jgi:hypothetical protein
VREWTFNLPKRDDAIVIERSEWHFEQDVYGNQLQGATEDEVKAKSKRTARREYIDVMEETVYCLCPSGNDTNSIRLCETIKFVCKPTVWIPAEMDLALLDSPKLRVQF